MSRGRILLWGLLVLTVLFIAYNPGEAAGVVRVVFGTAGHLALGLWEFLVGLGAA